MALMTDEEKDALFEAIWAAEDAGNDEEANRLKMMLPFGPLAAKAIKKYIPGGKELLRNFNLSEADAMYGPGWLDE